METPDYEVRTANLVHDVVASTLGSVRLLIPILLTVLLFWFLVEISLTLRASARFHSLAWLVWLALVIMAAVVIMEVFVPRGRAWVKKRKERKKGREPNKQPFIPSGPAPIMPLLLWNVVLIAAVMRLAEAWSPKVNFTYPLLRLYQFLFRLILG